MNLLIAMTNPPWPNLSSTNYLFQDKSFVALTRSLFSYMLCVQTHTHIYVYIRSNQKVFILTYTYKYICVVVSIIEKARDKEGR